MTDRELTTLVTAITASVKEELARDLLQLTPRDGKDGKDADPAVLLTLQAKVDTLHTLLSTRPRPTLEELRPMLEAEVTRTVALRPTAKDGVSLTGALIDRAGHLVLTVSDGRSLDVGIVTGAPGPPGVPGLNGTNGMDGTPGTNGTNGTNGTTGRDAVLKGGLVLKRLDLRRFQFCWSDDGTPVSVVDAAGTAIDPVIRFPVPLHKGVWTEGQYEQDDEVIRDGSVWLAKCATSNPPGSPDWVLRTKRGVEGPRGKPGDPGPPGRDLTQMDVDGRKW